MYHKVIFKDLNLQPSVCIKVMRDVAPDAKHAYGDTKCIVYNSCEDGTWSREEKDSHFPFVAGSEVERYIMFEGNHFVVRMSDGFHIHFPNHFHLKTLNYLSATGDFNIKMLDFE